MGDETRDRSSEMAYLEGAMINVGDTEWEEGSVVVVRVCAQFGAWSNHAKTGELRFWKWFEPTVN